MHIQVIVRICWVEVDLPLIYLFTGLCYNWIIANLIVPHLNLKFCALCNWSALHFVFPILVGIWCSQRLFSIFVVLKAVVYFSRQNGRMLMLRAVKILCWNSTPGQNPNMTPLDTVALVIFLGKLMVFCGVLVTNLDSHNQRTATIETDIYWQKFSVIGQFLWCPELAKCRPQISVNSNLRVEYLNFCGAFSLPVCRISTFDLR